MLFQAPSENGYEPTENCCDAKILHFEGETCDGRGEECNYGRGIFADYFVIPMHYLPKCYWAQITMWTANWSAGFVSHRVSLSKYGYCFLVGSRFGYYGDDGGQPQLTVQCGCQWKS